MQLTVNRRVVLALLYGAAGAVVIVGAAAQIAQPHVRYSAGVRLLNMLRLDAEWNLPTWFSGLCLLLAACLLALIAGIERDRGQPFVYRWRGLAVIFFILSLDEIIGLHELLNPITRDIFAPSRTLALPWVVPALILVGILLILYLPLLRSLDAPIRIRMLLAGFIYVVGATGLESVSGIYFSSHQYLALSYNIWASAEETAEILGIVLFIDVLLLHIAGHFTKRDVCLNIRFR